MNFLIKAGVLLPVTWILIQNLLLIFMGIWTLRSWNLIKEPLSGLEYSQALPGAALLLGILLVGNVSVAAINDTYLNYSAQGGEWVRSSLIKYSQLFLVTLVCEFLFVGLSWLALKIFFGIRKNEETVAGGNLPLAIFMTGIVIGLALGIGKLLGLILEGMTPHFAVFN